MRIKYYKEDGFIIAEKDNEVVGSCRYRIGNHYKNEYPEIDCKLCTLYVKPEEKNEEIVLSRVLIYGNNYLALLRCFFGVNLLLFIYIDKIS